jgi:hypothetical protein
LFLTRNILKIKVRVTLTNIRFLLRMINITIKVLLHVLLLGACSICVTSLSVIANLQYLNVLKSVFLASSLYCNEHAEGKFIKYTIN